LARAGISYGRPVNGDSVIFEEKAGLVPIEILRDGAAVVGARLGSPQPLSVGAEIAIELVASAFRNFARRYRDCRSSTVHRLLRCPVHSGRIEEPRRPCRSKPEQR